MWKRMQQLLHRKTDEPVPGALMKQEASEEIAEAPEAPSREAGFEQLFRAFAKESAESPEALIGALDRVTEALLNAKTALDPEAAWEAQNAEASRVTGCAAPAMRVPLSHGQRQELAAWNRDYPEYRMSEAEYYRAIHEDTERK